MSKFTFRYKFEKKRYGFFDDPEQGLGPEWAKRIFEMVCNQALASQHGQGGVPGSAARSYGRVLEALDASTDEWLRLDRAEVEFLRGLLWNDRAGVAPIYARPFVLMQNEAQRVMDQGAGAASTPD